MKKLFKKLFIEEKKEVFIPHPEHVSWEESKRRYEMQHGFSGRLI